MSQLNAARHFLSTDQRCRERENGTEEEHQGRKQIPLCKWLDTEVMLSRWSWNRIKATVSMVKDMAYGIVFCKDKELYIRSCRRSWRDVLSTRADAYRTESRYSRSGREPGAAGEPKCKRPIKMAYTKQWKSTQMSNRESRTTWTNWTSWTRLTRWGKRQRGQLSAKLKRTSLRRSRVNYSFWLDGSPVVKSPAYTELLPDAGQLDALGGEKQTTTKL